jgi:hypothetical protein
MRYRPSRDPVRVGCEPEGCWFESNLGSLKAALKGRRNEEMRDESATGVEGAGPAC